MVFIYKVTSAKVQKSRNREVKNIVLCQECFILTGETGSSLIDCTPGGVNSFSVKETLSFYL